jgi:hypothetical protein
MAAQQMVKFLSISTQLAARAWRNGVVAPQNRPILPCKHKIATRFKEVCNLGNERPSTTSGSTSSNTVTSKGSPPKSRVMKSPATNLISG